MLKKLRLSLPETISLWVESTRLCDSVTMKYVEKTGYLVDEVWLNQLALLTQVVPKASALNWCHGRLLYALVREISERTAGKLSLAETGTARGFSAVCMAKALEDSNREGEILSFDILSADKRRYWNSLSDFGGRVSRDEILAPWNKLVQRIDFRTADFPSDLANIEPKRFHLVFLDAQHTYEHVRAEFHTFSRGQLPGDIILFDDVTPNKFPGVSKFVQEVNASGSYDVTYLGNQEERGYAVARKSN